MLTYLYLLFFLTLNIFIYIYLNKLLIIKPNILVFIILLFISIVFLHELNLTGNLMSSSEFNELFFFSYSLIAWFFLNKFMINQINKKTHFNPFNKLICTMIQKNILLNFLFLMSSITQIQILIK